MSLGWEHRGVPGPAGPAGRTWALGARQHERRGPAGTQATGVARPGRTRPVYEAMRAHTSAETAGESSDAAGESRHDQQTDAAGGETTRARCHASWRCGQTTRHAGRPTGGPQRIRPRRTSIAPRGRRIPAALRTAGGSGRGDRLGPWAEPGLSADAQAIEQENEDTYGGWLEGFEHRLKGEDHLKEKIAEGWRVSQTSHRPDPPHNPGHHSLYVLLPAGDYQGLLQHKGPVRKPRL